MENISELQGEIESAIGRSGVAPLKICDCARVISEVEKIYVEGRPRAWWMSLKCIYEVRHFLDNSGYIYAIDYVKGLFDGCNDSHKEIYFIADEDGDVFHVYKISPCLIREIIENCRYFEYYVVACDYSWLVAENDHGDIIICRAQAGRAVGGLS